MRTSFLSLFVLLFLSACGSGLDLKVSGTDLHMNGTLGTNSIAQVTQVLDANPAVNRLVLGDMPGSIDDDSTLALGYEMRRRGLNTHITATSDINSGAVDLFLSGVIRTREVGAKIGVHGWSDGVQEAADFPRSSDEHTKYINYTRTMLGSDEFYWFTIAAAPAADIHRMTDAEIARFGLITE